jgi:hypothetical protein
MDATVFRKIPKCEPKSTRFWAILVVCMAAFSGLTAAQSASPALMPVHEAYSNGDFEEVLARIEAYQNRHPRHSLTDSIFIAKHLAVVYASNPQTREKGRYFMFRMLEMNPSADLVDMFISQDLDQTFEKVRKEFLVRQSRDQKVKTPYAPTPKATPTIASSTEKIERTQPIPVAEAAPKQSGKTWLWVTGGVAVVAGAVTAYYLTLDRTTEGDEHLLDN